MNRILFEPEELDSQGRVMLRDYRAEHIRSVLKASPGKVLKTGIVNGACGTSTVLEVSETGVFLEPCHTEESPQPWFDLILAAPRPLVLKRLWPQLTALGAGRIVLVNAAKVEKFYFSSQWVDETAVRPLLVEGAVQAGTTHIPSFEVRMHLGKFMERELDASFGNALRLLAHPGARTVGFGDAGARPLLAIGPEGGWTGEELELFESKGFRLFSLGPRVLRSDTACIALIAVLDFALRGADQL